MFQKQINIQLLKQGDKKTHEIVFKSYYPLLFEFAKQYVYREDVAEDIAMNSFLKLWEKRNTLKDNSNIKNFLLILTKNDCLNYLRDRKKKTYLNSIEKQYGELNIVALDRLDTNKVDIEKLNNTIKSTIENMNPEVRRVFKMSRFTQLKYSEIAEILEISTKTVESRMTKALKMLRNNLKDYTFIFITFLLLVSESL